MTYEEALKYIYTAQKYGFSTPEPGEATKEEIIAYAEACEAYDGSDQEEDHGTHESR